MNPKHTNSRGVFAQTFDDGPSPYTDTILDTLKAYNVKASFFVQGNQINSERAKNSIIRMFNEGHLVGSHTYSHMDLTLLSDNQIIEEMNKTSELIYNIIGVKPAYMVNFV